MSLAFVFPGQGSQSIGMMGGLAKVSPVIESTFAEASAVLGYDLWRRCQEGPAELLNATECTQPAMLTAGVATYRLWLERGGAVPTAMAGHSLGEFTALVAAGTLDFKTAVELAKYRGELMQAAVPPGHGAMAAILGLEDLDIEEACREASQSEVVEAVNFNAPSQVVIAGSKAGVEKACEIAKANGAKRALPLPVSAPFHSSLLKPASDQLREYLAKVEFNAPQIPLINNVDVAIVTDPAAIKDALVRQAAGPVRWVESVQKMARDGVTHVIECGPGKVLSGLTKRIDGALIGASIFDPASLEEARKLIAG